MTRLSLRERFEQKFTDTGDCWEWTATLNNRGYGLIGVGGRAGTMRSAHRVAYELFIGPIPDGLDVHHECDNRRCVNPAHLRAVTHRENLLLGSGFAARNSAKTHCDNGHELTPDNVYRRHDAEPARMCRTCKRAADARYRAKRLSVETLAEKETA